MVICLERGADLHMAQLMPLPLTVSCFSKIQIGFTFLVVAHPGSPKERAVKCVCVCVLCVLTTYVDKKWTCKINHYTMIEFCCSSYLPMFYCAWCVYSIIYNNLALITSNDKKSLFTAYRNFVICTSIDNIKIPAVVYQLIALSRASSQQCRQNLLGQLTVSTQVMNVNMQLTVKVQQKTELPVCNTAQKKFQLAWSA